MGALVTANVTRETPASMTLGAMWALLTVVIWSAWPSYTRLSITTTLSPLDLVALRYAIGSLLLLPVLIRHGRHISPRGWREGLVLAVLQGAPLAILVTAGLRFAPAGHMAALSPGLLPLFAAFISYFFFGEQLSGARICGLALITLGALALVFVSIGALAGAAWKGVLFFLCAGMLGATYAVRMRRSGLSAMESAALISVYSMLFCLPLYAALWLPSSNLFAISRTELLFQGFYQGVLMGAVSLFSLSRAIVALGATRATAFISLVPVLGSVLGTAILGEVPSMIEGTGVICISVGVLLTTGIVSLHLRRRRHRSTIPTSGYSSSEKIMFEKDRA
jgi:drug/metabolite transporter (DMT)-like permease